jgi:hypothetical protein
MVADLIPEPWSQCLVLPMIQRRPPPSKRMGFPYTSVESLSPRFRSECALAMEQTSGIVLNECFSGVQRWGSPCWGRGRC